MCRLIRVHLALGNAREARRYIDLAATMAMPSESGVTDVAPQPDPRMTILNGLALGCEALPVDEHGFA